MNPAGTMLHYDIVLYYTTYCTTLYYTAPCRHHGDVCTGTTTGVFCRGANDENAFSLIAAKESSGAWHAGQTSIGIKPSSSMRNDEEFQ